MEPCDPYQFLPKIRKTAGPTAHNFFYKKKYFYKTNGNRPI